MSTVVLIYGCCYGVHAGKKLQSMANQYRLGNRQNEERSPYHDAIYLRLFGSNISIIPTTTHNALKGNNISPFINRGPRSVSSILFRDNMLLSSLYPAIGGQTGAAPAVGSDYQRSGTVAGNSSNANSISSFNNGINTTTGTRNDELCRDNSSFKRSRSPDPFTRGEASNQGSEIDGRFSRRRTLPPPFHPYQDNVNMSSLPTTTFWDPFIMYEDTNVDAGLSSSNSTTTTTQSEINSSPGGPAGFFGDHDSSHYSFPTRSLNNLSRLRLQEDPSTNLLRGRQDLYPTSASFLYPYATTRGATSSSSQGTSFSQNGDNSNNLDFFDTFIQQGMDNAYVESTTIVQPHVRLLTEGRVNQTPSPPIIPVWPSSFVPPRQSITTSNPSTSNYQLNRSPSLPRSGFTIATQTIQFIHTGSGSQRSETVAQSSGSYRNLISTSRELSIERDMLRVEVYILSYLLVNINFG